MSSRILRLAFLLAVVFLVSGLFILNPSSISVGYLPGRRFSAPLALVLVGIFCFGALISALFTFAVSVRYKLFRRQTERRDRIASSLNRLMQEARAALAMGDHAAAETLFGKIIRRDPDDTIARILLARTLLDSGRAAEALEVLDTSRAERRHNVEVLLLAAEINGSMGNHTAAHDNISLLLRENPGNELALREMVSHCRRLDRFEEAIAYQLERIRASQSETAKIRLQDELAELELELELKKHGSDGESLEKALWALAKKHKSCASILANLAEMARLDLRPEDACGLWIKAFRISDNPDYLERIAVTWLAVDEPDRAIATLRKAIGLREKDSGSSFGGSLFLVNFLMHLEMLTEAQSELEKLKELPSPSGELHELRRLLECKLLIRMGEHEKAAKGLFSLLKSSRRIPGDALGRNGRNPDDDRWREIVKNRIDSEKTHSPELSVS